jgi:hypothetical protein
MRKALIVVASLVVALLGLVNTAQATVATNAASEVAAKDANCTYPFCGRVENLSGRTLQLSQNYTDSGGCVGPYADLPSGENSYKNPYKDTDCFRSNECSVFYLGWHSPGEWVRIHDLPTPVIVVNLSC